MRRVSLMLFSVLMAVGLLGATSSFAADAHTTSKFEGPKANTGTVKHSRDGGKDMLTWSDDYKIPDTPAPHWQVVDSKGNVYLLQQQRIKGDKQNRAIAVPSYVKDIAKVQVWCSFAEALLGEASFPAPLKTAAAESETNMMTSSR